MHQVDNKKKKACYIRMHGQQNIKKKMKSEVHQIFTQFCDNQPIQKHFPCKWKVITKYVI